MDPVLPSHLRISQRIGAGGMGVVYAGQDAEGRPIAIKTLQFADGGDILKLKREFRALADLAHENLVSLYELGSAGKQVWFTMERIDGRTFVDHVRRRVERRALVSGGTAGLDTLDLDALRGLLRQLAAGIEALHRAGRLHRDIKPSNVLVTREGRVKILDFGVTTLLGPRAWDAEAARRVVGTVAYMAPEQGWGMEVGPAADWYAVGVMLYEALTGQRPFQGALIDVLSAKDARAYPPLRDRAPEAPPDLAALVEALLDPDPRGRPDAEGLRALLNGAPPTPAAPLRSWPFVGRQAERDALSAALAAGRAAIVHVTGAPGLGKTALIESFLDAESRAGGAVILTSRCSPEEQIPYPALDGLIDGLCRYLTELPEAERRALIRPEMALLARLFPVLSGVPDLPWNEAQPVHPNPQVLRRRVARELGHLLRRLGARRPLIAWIDDAQWADPDSALILRALLDGDGPPAVLLLLSWRPGGDAEGLRLLREAPVPSLTLSLAPLGVDELADLLRARGMDPARAPALMADSGGDPLLVGELLVAGESAGGTSLGALLRARIARRSPTEGRLIALIAVAGRPLPASEALEAAEAGESGPELLRRLGKECLLRRTQVEGAIEVDVYHPRVREEVLAGLSPATRAGLRARLEAVAAIPIEATDERDPAALVRLDQAAAAASAAFAYHLAARLYLLALRLAPPGSPPAPRLIARADALSKAGRAAEAAAVFEEAAACVLAGDPALPELRRQSADHYLRCGRLEEGMAGLDRALGSVGLGLPATPNRALLAVLGLRLFLYLFTFVFGLRPRPARGPLDPTVALQIDTCWTAAMGLIWVDAIQSAVFQCRFTQLALRHGEPQRAAMALATEAAFTANEGGARNRARSARALQAALAVPHPTPLVAAIVQICRAGAAFFCARFAEAEAAAGVAEALLLEHAPGAIWERTNGHIFGTWAIALRGDLRALEARLGPIVAEAKEQGNLLCAASLSTGFSILLPLAHDRPAEARRMADDAMAMWPSGGTFQTQHYMDLIARVNLALYEGRAPDAYARAVATLPKMKAAMMMMLQFVRMDATHLAGRAAVAVAGQDPAARAMAKKAARSLSREDLSWGQPLAWSLEAGLSALDGEREQAIKLFANAAQGFSEHGMRLHAAAARFQAETLAGTVDPGAELRAAGVRDPVRFAAVLAPVGSGAPGR